MKRMKWTKTTPFDLELLNVLHVLFQLFLFEQHTRAGERLQLRQVCENEQQMFALLNGRQQR